MDTNKQPSRSQSYTVIAPSRKSARELTKKLASDFGIKLEKVSPDVFFIKAAKREISIDQIREIKRQIFQKPLEHKFKFIIIENAHLATTAAQNSLLKILEEPPTHAVLVLEAKNKALLLPTITSRTTQIQSEADDYGSEKTLLDLNFKEALETIGSIENGSDFLDEEMLKLTKRLESKAEGVQDNFTYAKLSEAMEKYARAKDMVNANINPQFALAGLIFSLNLQSK